MLATEAVTAAPEGLAAAVCSVALAGETAGTGIALTVLKLMTATKSNLGVATLVIAGVATTPVIQYVDEGI